MAEEQQTAMQRWKEKHRDYYLAQKRRLAARPEYKAHRREMYRAKVEEYPGKEEGLDCMRGKRDWKCDDNVRGKVPRVTGRKKYPNNRRTSTFTFHSLFYSVKNMCSSFSIQFKYYFCWSTM